MDFEREKRWFVNCKKFMKDKNVCCKARRSAKLKIHRINTMNKNTTKEKKTKGMICKILPIIKRKIWHRAHMTNKWFEKKSVYFYKWTSIKTNGKPDTRLPICFDAIDIYLECGSEGSGFVRNSFLKISFGGSISLAMLCSVSSDSNLIFWFSRGRIQLGTCSWWARWIATHSLQFPW